MKILNFGSLNIDHVYAMDRFVMAGETKDAAGYAIHAGGKGMNQAVALAKSGAPVWMAGCIGAEGRFLQKILEQNGVHTEYIRELEVPTGHAMIQVNEQGQNCIILYGGANRCVTEEMIDRTLEGFEAGDILLLQNEINGLEMLMRKAFAKGMRIALNPSPISEELKKLPVEIITWFVLNEVEGEELSGESAPDEMLRVLREKYPACRVVLTLGKRGVKYADAEQVCEHGIYPVKAVDTTGAGDTFLGYFLGGVAKGMAVPEILEWASKAAALAVTKPGAAEAIPTAAEVDAAKF